MTKKWLYLPAEIASRELRARARVAVAASERGFHVLLGGRTELQAGTDFLAPGAYVDTNVPVQAARPADRVRHLDARRRRHILNAVLDEEGLVYPSADVYLSMRTSGPTLERVDAMITWGTRQQQEFQAERPQIPFIALGNPRVDEWHDARVARSSESTPLPVLFASNFPLVTHAAGARFSQEQFDRYGWNDMEHVAAFLEARVAQAESDRDVFLRCLRSTAVQLEQERRPLILRPHPADNRSQWRGLVSDIPNVIIDADGPSIDAIRRSAAVVHVGCTTGVEAYFAGVPTFSLKRQDELEGPAALPDYVSTTVAVDGVAAALRAAASQRPAELESSVVALTGEPGASGRIADWLAEVTPPVAADVDVSGLVSALRRRRLRSRVGSSLGMIRHRSHYAASSQARQYYAQKYTVQQHDEVHARLVASGAVVERIDQRLTLLRPR